MAYGLIINDTTGNEWFNSTTSFGFIEITSFSVNVNGSTGNSDSGTLSGYSAIYPVYVPSAVIDDETSSDTRRPVLASTFNSSTGAWTVTQTWSGTDGGGDTKTDVSMNGGRVIIFAH